MNYVRPGNRTGVSGFLGPDRDGSEQVGEWDNGEHTDVDEVPHDGTVQPYSRILRTQGLMVSTRPTSSPLSDEPISWTAFVSTGRRN